MNQYKLLMMLQGHGETKASSQVVPEDKVAVVSRAVREALQARSAAAYLRPIVTSHAITGDLEGALAAIKEAKEAQLLCSSPGAAPRYNRPHYCFRWCIELSPGPADMLPLPSDRALYAWFQ